MQTETLKNGTEKHKNGTAKLAAVAVDAEKLGSPRFKQTRRRPPDQLHSLAERIAALVSTHPDGMRAVEIGRYVGMTTRQIRPPLNIALRRKLLKKGGGVRHTMTYHYVGEGQPALVIREVKTRSKPEKTGSGVNLRLRMKFIFDGYDVEEFSQDEAFARLRELAHNLSVKD